MVTGMTAAVVPLPRVASDTVDPAAAEEFLEQFHAETVPGLSPRRRLRR